MRETRCEIMQIADAFRARMRRGSVKKDDLSGVMSVMSCWSLGDFRPSAMPWRFGLPVRPSAVWILINLPSSGRLNAREYKDD